MSKIAMPVLLATLAGCYPDVATEVNVSPEAEHMIDEIVSGVDEMNGLLGREIFTVRMVDSNARRDEEIVIRYHPEPFKIPAQAAEAESTSVGVIISMQDRCTSRCVMHEIGHAAGLGHVRDKENTMNIVWGHAKLTEDQKESILMLDYEYRRGR